MTRLRDIKIELPCPQCGREPVRAGFFEADEPNYIGVELYCESTACKWQLKRYLNLADIFVAEGILARRAEVDAAPAREVPMCIYRDCNREATRAILFDDLPDAECYCDAHAAWVHRQADAGKLVVLSDAPLSEIDVQVAEDLAETPVEEVRA